MHRAPRMQSEQQGKRAGFTLIELLVVIGIIALLSALLLGGIQSARRAVNHAQATQDIRNLESALASFHAEFGSYPPSSIVLYENKLEWTADSRQKIQALWPSFNFNADHNFNGINGPGETNVSVTLNGAECLVFFLTGMIPPPPESETTANKNDGVPRDGVPRGFSSNPANPFKIDSGKRVGPFIELIESGSRQLVHPDPVAAQAVEPPSPPPPAPTTDEGYREYVGEYTYLDSYQGQALPIWYVSAYGGDRYVDAELPFSMQIVNGGNSVYRQGSTASSPPWKKDSYQLISPGREGESGNVKEYGTGGWYSSSGSNISQEDKDNITNFATNLN